MPSELPRSKEALVFAWGANASALPLFPAGGETDWRIRSRTPHRPIAERLIRRAKPPKHMLGDKAYDSAELRNELHERGTKPVIPNRSNRKQPFSFNKRLYKLRWRVENAFSRLKDFRRIATRYDRLARNYLASVCLAAALVWWI
jgi:transposase